MILNIHSEASYLGTSKAKSCMTGHFLLVWLPQDKQLIKLNGPICILTSLLQFAVSADEAELCALFVNAKKGKIIHLILEEMGHPQPPTPIHCDNATVIGITNDTMKKQCSQSMEI